MITKKKILFESKNKKLNIGIDKHANIDERDEYFEIKKVTIQIIPKKMPRKISKLQSIPT